MDAILERKYRALEDFTARVRTSPVGNRVARMILYGSLLRGDAGPESDVDLLVVATGDVRAVGQALGDIAFEVMLEHGELVSPIVYCPDEYRHPHYFLRQVRETGKEVYRVDENTMRRQEALDLLALAQGYLEMARALKGQREYIRGVIDMAYNAAELSAKGLLLLREGEWPKTYSGVVQQFSRAFIVNEPVVEPGLGRAFRQALDWRHRARYDPHATLSEADAEDVIGVAEKLADLLQREVYAS
ncbi:MAG: HEPN domain-containing protein [Thermoflexales bacterium]|nr:HEPN domain-containing protein [Thermoflexales bacterium]